MGTGKSTVGRMLAEIMGFDFVDTDEIVEAKTGKTISAIFEKEGEASFRKIEKEVVGEICAGKNRIISTGGGAITSEGNLRSMRGAGPVVTLLASADEILKRTRSEAHRPLLENEDRKKKIEELLNSRREWYLKADLVIETDGKTPGEIAKEILRKIETLGTSKTPGR